ncbi:3',5'-cyclic adenosine monophosphate phosphodiesterase CpdA [Dyadobacter beijingensis]|uniref:3',5'-cyclic adenosine monophosphate phosphodiesterase CpdA n=1 Tax=Dyadobacter beijingensis TaxID=365489 RepID=A0ABQ2HLI1_9BACT|nr:metallophosphoesterase [Dyadobacter beijingensis]GGM83790.1 3',5'-cyclic adenosine monophosphate phosphodiesterase CpdA [Dyadobacter beijingensis]
MKRIAQITDIHLMEEWSAKNGADTDTNLKLILQDVGARGIRDVIFTGDIGHSDAYERFFALLKGFRFTVIPGNHDKFVDIKPHYHPSYLSTKTEMYHSEEDAHFKYIFLDSSSDSIGDVQLQWLAHELVTTKRVLLFVHHPVLQVFTAVDFRYPLLNREAVKEVLVRSDREIVVFSGHYHTDDFTKEENIMQYVTPASSVQMEKNPSEIVIHARYYGYRIIELDGRTVRTEVVLNHGSGFDVVK